MGSMRVQCVSCRVGYSEEDIIYALEDGVLSTANGSPYCQRCCPEQAECVAEDEASRDRSAKPTCGRDSLERYDLAVARVAGHLLAAAELLEVASRELEEVLQVKDQGQSDELMAHSARLAALRTGFLESRTTGCHEGWGGLHELVASSRDIVCKEFRQEDSDDTLTEAHIRRLVKALRLFDDTIEV